MNIEKYPPFISVRKVSSVKKLLIKFGIGHVFKDNIEGAEATSQFIICNHPIYHIVFGKFTGRSSASENGMIVTCFRKDIYTKAFTDEALAKVIKATSGEGSRVISSEQIFINQN